MNLRIQRLVKPGASIFGGIIFVAMLGGFFRPIQNDLGHAVGMLTMDGGKVMHPIHYTMGEGLFGRFTLFITASAIPPVRGDFIVEIEGPEELDYSISSRFPPSVPILNRGHTWFKFKDGEHLGVYPGDDLIVVVRMKPPSEPGEYQIMLKDKTSGMVYLSVPTIFEPTKNKYGQAEEDCH